MFSNNTCSVIIHVQQQALFSRKNPVQRKSSFAGCEFSSSLATIEYQSRVYWHNGALPQVFALSESGISHIYIRMSRPNVCKHGVSWCTQDKGQQRKLGTINLITKANRLESWTPRTRLSAMQAEDGSPALITDRRPCLWCWTWVDGKSTRPCWNRTRIESDWFGVCLFVCVCVGGVFDWLLFLLFFVVVLFVVRFFVWFF